MGAGEPTAAAEGQSGSRTVRVVVTGRVQGVGYRGWTVERARTAGLVGWVRNRRDGSVEALFHGPAAAVAAMVEACHLGPSAAQVRRVEVSEATAEAGDLHAFDQRPTE